MIKSFQRRHFGVLRRRLEEPAGFLQVLVGPRQVGKTTLAQQLESHFGDRALYRTADEASAAGGVWIQSEWLVARELAHTNGFAVLILDEIQKIEAWSESVKRLVDEDRRAGTDLRVLILGSAALVIGQGLSDSLAGRFERTWMGHWTWLEMHEAFGYRLDEFLRFGGYPGAARLRHDPERWQAYIRDSVIDATVSRDVLQLTRIDKPALLRAVMELACAYSTRELSYQKMLGQLQSAGHTVTLAHYLELLRGAGLVRGLQKFAGEVVRRRASSPKLLALDSSLVTATQGWMAMRAEEEPQRWGQLVETAVGAHLHEAEARHACELYYWRKGPREVDFVLCAGRKVVGIEVKSGRLRDGRGLMAFCREFDRAKVLIVGNDGVELSAFLARPAEEWLEFASPG